MRIDKTSALVDADFINGLGNCNLSCEILIERLKVIFKEMYLNAIVHPLIYTKELLDKGEKILLLFSGGVLKQISYEDICSNDESKEEYYSMLVEELYYHINGEKIELRQESVFEFWRSEKNLGEVHSLATCLLCDCTCFLSDDDHSRRLSNYIMAHYKKYIRIYDRMELIEKHHEDGDTSIKRAERRSITHGL